ncbi:MAG TPA: hypothetical protein VJT67_02675 [Longimicrobiaceae bacterium]|nr:hypothetical protein [Longimicrobiaceae bacterium]
MNIGRCKSVDRSVAEKYRRVALSFLEGARILAELADENDPTGNAIAVITVHAAIAWSDALTIAYAGMKSTDGDHNRAADLLHNALGARIDAQALRSLRMVLHKKDTVAYRGDYYRVPDALALLERAEEFCAWANDAYENRPRN